MNYIILGNIIALLASLIMVYSGFLKQKKKILYVQTIQIGLYVLSNAILGGISGAIINGVSCIRNILCYKDKLGIASKIIISIFSIVAILLFNNLGLIGILPLISTLIYLWFMNIKDIIKFKIIIIITMVLWFVYDTSIKSYTSAFFDIGTALANIISIYQLNRNKIKNL